MNILLTGYSGSLGTVVSEQLIKAGHEVNALLHGSVINPQTLSPEVRIVWGSLSQPDILERETRNMDVVIHCAWDGRRSFDESLEKINLAGTKNLIKSAEKNMVKTFIHISSVAVYGLDGTLWGRMIDETETLVEKDASLDSYPWVKVLIENYCDQLKNNSRMNINIIRPGLFFSDAKAPAKKLVSIGNRRYGLLVGNGRNHLPYIHVGDVALMVMKIIENSSRYAVYNCVPTLQLSCAEFLVKWGMSRGIRLKVVRLQPFVIRFMNVGIRWLKRIMGKTTAGSNSDYQIASGVRNIRYNPQKAIEQLGWKDVRTRAIAESSNL